MLTGKQIFEKGIVTKVANPEKQIQQVGIDLTISYFSKVDGVGFIPKDGKTILPNYTKLEWPEDNILILQPGIYECVFNEGCNFDSRTEGKIIHRSSVLRSGSILMSAEFDPGFETENIGSFITVNMPIKIEKGARLGQMTCNLTDEEVENTYNGQWQKDKQR